MADCTRAEKAVTAKEAKAVQDKAAAEEADRQHVRNAKCQEEEEEVLLAAAKTKVADALARAQKAKEEAELAERKRQEAVEEKKQEEDKLKEKLGQEVQAKKKLAPLEQRAVGGTPPPRGSGLLRKNKMGLKVKAKGPWTWIPLLPTQATRSG